MKKSDEQLKLQPILAFAHSILNEAIHEDDIAVDATVGNGHDTTFLCKLVGENGKVYGFDIQKVAIERTMEQLKSQELHTRATLFHTGHEQLLQSIPPENHSKIKGAIFNLGYLPKGDKSIVTHGDTTISAVKQLLSIMSEGAVIILVVYHGHPEGKQERNQLIEFVKKIDQKEAHVAQYGFINQINHPPFIIAIEKR